MLSSRKLSPEKALKNLDELVKAMEEELKEAHKTYNKALDS